MELTAENPLKTTEKLSHEIKTSTNIGDYLTSNKEHMLTGTLSQHLNLLLTQKNRSRADVIHDSLLDRSYVYQIFSGARTPSRDKLIAIAFGLHLTADETQKMLKLSGNRELYARDERDAVILFSLHQRKKITETNALLFSRNLLILGSY